MTYIMHCRHLDSYPDKTFTVSKERAEQVLADAENLERSDVRIEHIDTPEHGRLDMWGFRKLYGKRDQ
jgi:hypothetical protein